MMFESVIGHENVRQRLEKSIISNKISHAYIFAGKRGVGKKTVANAFADILTNGSIADVITVTNEQYGIESKSDIVSVDTIRAASADMYMKPYLADKRVFIIPDAEKMNAQAQNALLKIFEEGTEEGTKYHDLVICLKLKHSIIHRSGCSTDSNQRNAAKQPYNI